MAKNSIKFTKAILNELPIPKNGRAYYYNRDVKGLLVQVTEGGSKSFQVRKKLNGRSIRVTLGTYPDMTIEIAEKNAHIKLAEISDNIDPNQKKKANRVKGITLQECFDDYLKTKTGLKPGTVHDYKRVMNEGFRDWKNKPLKNITRDLVAAKHRKLGASSEARANNAMRVLRALFNFAGEVYEDNQGKTLFPDNPVKRLSKTKTWYTVARKQTVIKAHELKIWIEAVLSLSPNDGALYQTAKDYFLVLILTGMRKTECAKLLWENIDFNEKTLKIVDTKNNKPHTLPLSDYLYCLLKELRKRTFDHYVFPSKVSSTGYISDLRKFVSIVETRSGVDFTLHDIRRTFITIAESLDISVYALKRLVNHSIKTGDVTDGYIVTDVERLRKPMQQITDFILKAAEIKRTADVLELREI